MSIHGHVVEDCRLRIDTRERAYASQNGRSRHTHRFAVSAFVYLHAYAFRRLAEHETGRLKVPNTHNLSAITFALSSGGHHAHSRR